MDVTHSIELNLRRIRERIARACDAAGRSPDEVQLMLATKTVPAERVAVAVRLGARLIGENRVQELAEKDSVLRELDCERHFIGRLQTNKVNQVLRYVTCVQSLDRLDLADRLQRRSETTDGTVDVLLQVNTSAEESKGGVTPDAALSFARDVSKRDRLRIRGLMTIGHPDPTQVRTSYKSLHNVRNDIEQAGIDRVFMDTLSMGMSGDLEAAIAEGATMIRVGSAIFGLRTG